MHRPRGLVRTVWSLSLTPTASHNPCGFGLTSQRVWHHWHRPLHVLLALPRHILRRYAPLTTRELVRSSLLLRARSLTVRVVCRAADPVLDAVSPGNAPSGGAVLSISESACAPSLHICLVFMLRTWFCGAAGQLFGAVTGTVTVHGSKRCTPPAARTVLTLFPWLQRRARFSRGAITASRVSTAPSSLPTTTVSGPRTMLACIHRIGACFCVLCSRERGRDEQHRQAQQHPHAHDRPYAT